jgi:ribosomal protein S6--L-glutamate ligase
MKLAILSRAPRAYSTQRLRTAALDRGHQVRVLDTLRFAIDLSTEQPDLFFRGKQLSSYDAILPRIGASITYFGTAVVRQFEQMDVYTPNTANGIMNSRDKLRATQILSRHNIGMPATAFVRNRADVVPAIEMVGGAPVVIKLLEGTQGIGVILAPSRKVAEAIIETLHGTNQQVLIQAFVKESKGRDIRAIVVGDRVVAAMRRVAQGDEFRSNVHRGGRVEPVESGPDLSGDGGAGGADHGPARRRRRHARGQRRAARHGGQLLPRPPGHRVRDQPRRRRARSSTTSPTRPASPRSTCASG